jgi:hypothetical protein
MTAGADAPVCSEAIAFHNGTIGPGSLLSGAGPLSRFKEPPLRSIF